jgi:XTP/dITP diphosphohydrolase
MNKIKEIIIGSNNIGKYKEISSLLPKNIKKYSPKTFKISSPKETGKTFEKNSLIKASYFCKKTNLICISDDSGLEIDILNRQPGIYSSRWAGEKNNFNLAIKKIFKKLDFIRNKNLKKNYRARFICCLTIFCPNGKIYTSKGIVNGKISTKKKGKNGFGYDPIFIPNGYTKTFGEMNPKLKMSIDHRFKAFLKIKKFFTNKP